jgi:hypothetical protein
VTLEQYPGHLDDPVSRVPSAHRGPGLPHRLVLLVGLLLLTLLVGPPRPARAVETAAEPFCLGESWDPLDGILARINNYFHRHETNGVTLDSRYSINPAEVTRLSIVSQLLGYCELYRVTPSRVCRQDIAARADYLVEQFDAILGHSPFDGMLGCALLQAYEVTGDPRYFSKGSVAIKESLPLHGFSLTLNWGLMAAMGFSKYYALTGDPAIELKTHQVIASLLGYQHPDGSFAHYCPYSTDVHYTSWMAMELITIKRWFSDPNLDRILDGTRRFLLGRVDSLGVTHYEERCPECVGGWRYYYSINSGCPQDYDTRGWINELGYNALLFSHTGEDRYGDVMRRLRSLENHGTFPDKWGYLPSLSDPIYPWATASPSVIRMSVLFWSLASIRADRAREALAVTTGYDSVAAGARSSGVAPVVEFEGPLPGDFPGGSGGTPASDPLADAACRNGQDFYFAEPWLWMPPEARAGLAGPEGQPGRLAGERSRAPDGAAGAAGLDLTVLHPGRAGRSVEIRFTLARDADVTLAVYDVTGRRVRELFDGPLARGEHRASWDGRDAGDRTVATGVYFIRLVSGGEARTARTIVAP